MIYYKIRRKSDGVFHPFERRTKQKQDSFYRQYASAVDWYNGMGWDGDMDAALKRWRERKVINWHYRHSTEEEMREAWKKRPTYDSIELVKFGPTGEVVIWSGPGKCELTKKEADKLEPVGAAPLTAVQKQAGIRDEIGPMLDKIDDAEKTLKSGQVYDVGALFAEIDMKKTKLSAALDELEKRSTEMHKLVNKILLS